MISFIGVNFVRIFLKQSRKLWPDDIFCAYRVFFGVAVNIHIPARRVKCIVRLTLEFPDMHNRQDIY